ncbi:MAG TPA: AAA family ATPase [Anaerolineaceae bacterium]|nr:AAA family ATPase [Anaerolineaceae bacterium]
MYSFNNLSDALAPRPKLRYLIEDLIPERSFSAFYGYPGSLKSSLVMDAAMAVATGKRFLPGLPGGMNSFPGFRTEQAPVCWIDLDNGNDVTCERISAFARAYQQSGAVFYWISYPAPSLQMSRRNSVNSLQASILALPERPGWIIIDTLLRSAGVRDENSSEMDAVMGNLHNLAENIGAALTVVSHSKKENVGRARNGLRGHSSIEGGVDSVFLVLRDENSDLVEVINQKARRRPVEPFGARWTFTADSISHELTEARFYWEPISRMTKAQSAIFNLCQLITDHLKQSGDMNQGALYNLVGGNKHNFDRAIERLKSDGLIIITTGAKNAKFIKLQLP